MTRPLLPAPGVRIPRGLIPRHSLQPVDRLGGLSRRVLEMMIQVLVHPLHQGACPLGVKWHLAEAEQVLSYWLEHHGSHRLSFSSSDASAQKPIEAPVDLPFVRESRDGSRSEELGEILGEAVGDRAHPPAETRAGSE